MIYLSTLVIEFLLFARSIDNAGDSGSSSEQIIHQFENIDISEDAEDFSYSGKSMYEISCKKLPFINCNRKIFCNSDFDLIGIYQSNEINSSTLLYFVATDFSGKLGFIENCIFSGLFENKKEAVKNLPEYILRDQDLRKMHNEFLIFSTILEKQSSSLVHKDDVYTFVKAIDTFICNSQVQRINSLLLDLKLSTIFNRIFDKEGLSLSEIKIFMYEFIGICKPILNNLQKIIVYYANNSSVNCEDECYTSSILKKDLFFKWLVESEMNRMIGVFKDSKQPIHMMIYSTNADAALIEEMSDAVREVIDGNFSNLVKEEENHSIEYTFMKRSFTSEGRCYDIKLKNGKSYIAKIFNLENDDDIESGLFKFKYFGRKFWIYGGYEQFSCQF